ncbi:MAG: tetratricopeptide repeat protein [Nitrospirae bacterium]|nr:tetratricopeptide repeat protein [Nitrospirota bacterium]
MFKDILYKPLFHLFLIILFGFLAYSNTFHSPFTFDDANNIVENRRLKDISNIPSFFTSIERPPIMARPFTAATFAVNHHFGKLNTTGYHIFNIVVHIANGILLYLLIILTARLTGFDDDKKSVLIALFSSLIFTAHPIQTESVTYMVSRSVLLSTFFFLLGIILFTKTVATEGKRKLVYRSALFVTSLFGMASREEFFIFPVMLVLYDLYFVSKQNIRGVLKNFKIHLSVILTLVYVIFIVTTYDYGEHAGYGVKALTPLQYLMTQFNAHWTYLRLLILPVNQNLDYDYPVAKTLFEFPTIISFMGYIGLWAFGIYLYRKRPVISFSILWFMITLFPSSGIMPIADVIFEHRLYMPLIGFVIIFSLGMFYVLEFSANRLRTPGSQFPLHGSCFIVLSAIVIVFSFAAYQRNAVWKNEITLWEDTVSKSLNKARPWNNLGNGYLKQKQPDKAIPMLKKALDLKYDSWANLGSAYIETGLFQEAVQPLKIALSLHPSFPDIHYNLGVAYHRLGQLDKAIEEYKTALSLNPDDEDTRYNLGLAYRQKSN